MRGKSIGLYGGSFDPVHFGHLNLALEMLEKADLDEVWFCPAHVSPHKLEEHPISSNDRLNMLKLALEGIPNCSILESELQQPFPSYTIDTIKGLLAAEKINPQNRQFYLLLGEDSLPGFPSWRDAHEIIRLVPLLIAHRPLSKKFENFVSDQKMLAAFQKGLLETRRMDISSSEIRERLAKGKCCQHLLPQKVLDYIDRYQLYSNLSL